MSCCVICWPFPRKYAQAVALVNFRFVFIPPPHAAAESPSQASVTKTIGRSAERNSVLCSVFFLLFFWGEFIVGASSVSSRSLIEWSQKEIKTWKIRYEKWKWACGLPPLNHWTIIKQFSSFWTVQCWMLLNCFIRLHAGEVQQRLRVKFRLSALDVRRNALLTRLVFEEMVNYGDESVRHTRNFSRSEVGGF